MSESDRELLELAAKAAGIEIHNAGFISGPHLKGTTRSWNPLAYDGDAFRLMCDLGIDVESYFLMRGIAHSERIKATAGDVSIVECASVPVYSSSRRAIVRAAAEIGRRMG